MKKLILMMILLTGCAADYVIDSADQLCNATTVTKDEYRACMDQQRQQIKQEAIKAGAAIKERVN